MTKEQVHEASKVVVVTGDVTMDWNIASRRRLEDSAMLWNPEN